MQKVLILIQRYIDVKDEEEDDQEEGMSRWDIPPPSVARGEVSLGASLPRIKHDLMRIHASNMPLRTEITQEYHQDWIPQPSNVQRRDL